MKVFLVCNRSRVINDSLQTPREEMKLTDMNYQVMNGRVADKLGKIEREKKEKKSRKKERRKKRQVRRDVVTIEACERLTE